MFYGSGLSRIESDTEIWTGNCNIKRKYSEKDSYRDINGVYRNRGYYLTFSIEFVFDAEEFNEEKMIRRMINSEEVTFYERYFEPRNTLNGTEEAIPYVGKFKLKKEELEPTTDMLEVEMIVEVDEINVRDYIYVGGVQT